MFGHIKSGKSWTYTGCENNSNFILYAKLAYRKGFRADIGLIQIIKQSYFKGKHANVAHLKRCFFVCVLYLMEVLTKVHIIWVYTKHWSFKVTVIYTKTN